MNNYRMGHHSKSAYQEIRGQGLDLPPKPESDMPQLPPDLTELGDQALMNLYQKYVSWSDYISVQVSCAQVDERNAMRMLDMSENMLLMETMARGKKITEARNEVKADPVLDERRESAFGAEAYRKMIESLLNNCERDAALISRELTRRTTESRRDKFL